MGADVDDAMTAPRQIEPGREWFITRRCAQQEFLLRPDEELSQIIAYCLAEAAERFRVQLIAWVVMSNHYHAVVHDTDGRLPAFLAHFHRNVAKAVNRLRGRHENMWSAEETCVTYLPTPEDVLEKVVYVLTNPVAANLVERAREWPGLHSIGHLDGRSTTHSRPSWYFKSTSKVMGASASLRAVVPPRLSRTAASRWASDVKDAVARRERLLRDARVSAKKRVLGAKAVLDTRPTARPARDKDKDKGKDKDKTKGRSETKLRPALACKNADRRREELARIKGFRAEYARKLALWVAAKKPEERHKIVFPAGTYRLRMLGVRCAPFERPAA